MGFISDNYGIEQTTPLMTDKYHFTTAYAYWLEGRAENPAVFYMFGRKEALHGGYTVAAGLEGVIDIVKRWQEYGFTDEDIKFLKSQRTASGKQQFPDAFLEYLKTMEFKLKIDAAPEGSVFFPQEAVLRVEGPIAQVKMLESVALGLINGHSAYATHAARQTEVAGAELENGSPQGSPSAQGLRRGPSLGAALESSRSLGLGGYTSTSTGTAAKQFGQAFAGTMDHAWVMTHEDEIGKVPMADLLKLQAEGKTSELQQALKKDAFRSFAMAHPENGILLVDTYDPLKGLENAITVIKELHALGLGQNYGVRFDSGDIAAYSKIALRRFGEEGFIDGLSRAQVKKMEYGALLKESDKCKVFCAAADGIDEHTTQEMRKNGAFFKSWGIGTAGSHVAPLGLVYKASSVYMDVLDGKPLSENAEMTPVMKVAAHAPVKSSNPGRINSRRVYDENGILSAVVIYDEALGLDPEGKAINLHNFHDQKTIEHVQDAKDLLVPVFNAQGDYVYNEPAKIESFPGSGKLVTKLAAIAQSIKTQIHHLPEGVRRIEHPRDEILQKKLLSVFKESAKAGNKILSLDVKEIMASLPPEVEHIPVYLDQKLFEQRLTCEEKHSARANRDGVAEYHERFEGGSEVPPIRPKNEGEFKVFGKERSRNIS